MDIKGYLAAKPELRFTESGTPVTELRIMENQYRKVGTEYVKEGTTVYDITCWGVLAEQAAANLDKGMRIGAEVRRLRPHTYTRGTGEIAHVIKGVAEEVGILLDRYAPKSEPEGTAPAKQAARKTAAKTSGGRTTSATKAKAKA